MARLRQIRLFVQKSRNGSLPTPMSKISRFTSKAVALGENIVSEQGVVFRKPISMRS